MPLADWLRQAGAPRGRAPGQEVGLARADPPVVEVLGVADRVVVEPAGAEHVRPVAPARPAHPPEPAPQRRQAEPAPARRDGRARAPVRVLHRLPPPARPRARASPNEGSLRRLLVVQAVFD